MIRCCRLLTTILIWLIEIDKKSIEIRQRNQKGKYDMSSHVTLLLLVILLLVLVIAVGFFIWHSMHSASARSSKQGGNTGKIRGQKRHFTAEDRKAVLLLRELSELMDSVDKGL